MSGPASAPRGERAGTPGVGWGTELRSTGEQYVPDGQPEPSANRAARRAVRRGRKPSGGRTALRQGPEGPQEAREGPCAPVSRPNGPPWSGSRQEPEDASESPNPAPPTRKEINMLDRPTASTITDDQLDALYGQLERVQRAADILRTANAPDGRPSPLRPAAHLIDMALGRNLTEETAA